MGKVVPDFSAPAPPQQGGQSRTGTAAARFPGGTYRLVGGALPGLRLCAKQALRPGDPPCPMPSVLSRLVGGALSGLRLCAKQALCPGETPCPMPSVLSRLVGVSLSGLCTQPVLCPGEGLLVLIGSPVRPAGIFCPALPKTPPHSALLLRLFTKRPVSSAAAQ